LAGYSSEGLVGCALDVSGSEPGNAHLKVEYSPSLEPAMGTIEAWVKVDHMQNADIVRKTTDQWLRTGATGSFSVYGLRIAIDGSVRALVGNDDSSGDHWTFASSAPGLVTVDTWHHLAMRWDGATLALFVDGVLRDEVAYDPVPGYGLSYHGATRFHLAVGTRWWGPDETYVPGTDPPSNKEYVGLIDDVRVYDGGLGDSDIRADYSSAGERPPRAPVRTGAMIQSIMYKRGAPDSDWCAARSCPRIASGDSRLSVLRRSC
jgi:hypothetical protein